LVVGSHETIASSSRNGQASGYLYLAPGTYSIALVPKGMGIDKAWLSWLNTGAR
jgi:hypothetical protein